MTNQNANEMLTERMNKIGPRKNLRGEKYENHLEKQSELVQVESKKENGTTIIKLTVEPVNMNEVGSEARQNFSEFCETINSLVDAEENDWDSLRLKDQIALVEEYLIKETIIKYAVEKLNLKFSSENTNTSIESINRYNVKDQFVGQAKVVTIMIMPGLFL